MSRFRGMSTTCAILFGVAALASSPPRASAATGGCGMEGCPLESRGLGQASSRFSFDLAWISIEQDRLWNGSRELASTEPAHLANLGTRTSAWVGSGRARVNDRLSVSASIAWFERTHRSSAEHHAGYFVPYQWDYAGLGDLMLLASVTPFDSWSGRHGAVSLLTGLKLPTGKRHVAPVDGFEPHPAARLGSGSLDGLVGLQLSRAFATTTALQGQPDVVPLTASATVRWNGRGTDGYRMGREVHASLDTNYPLIRGVRLVGQLSGTWQERDDPGIATAAPHHSGGTSALVTPGIRAQIGSSLTTYAYYQRRVYQRTNGPEAIAPSQWLIGTSYSLGR
jgi:hypothetical protein